MAKTIDEIKADLEKLGKTDILEGIIELINQEKEKGVSEVQKRNKEAQNLRKYKIALEAAGLTEDDDISEFLSGKTKRTDKSDSDNLTLKSLKAELDRVKQERDAERLNGKKKTLQAELTNALGDKVYGSKYLINSLISDGSFDVVDGEVVFKNGDEHLSFQDGVKHVLDSNKDLLKTSQAGGTKSTGSAGKVSKDIGAILNSNDPELIKNNLAEAAAALGLKI
jgi:hypothetical protein